MKLDSSLFYDEAIDLIHKIEELLFEVKNGNEADIKALFRYVHSIKGNGSIFGFDEIVNVTHGFEDILDLYRINDLKMSAASATAFLEVTHFIELLSKEYCNFGSITSMSNQIDEVFQILNNQSKVAQYQIRKKQFINLSAPTDTSVKARPEIQKKKILIVDDSSMIRNVASNAAFEAGYDVVIADDGTAGLDIASKQSFDLIFSDINMPTMGGLEMVSHIKSLQNNKFTPIVMMTTENDGDLKRQGKKIGVRAWLVKPFNKTKFLMVIEKILC
ncbi:MAG: response regulator [Campylobacterales bacterium]|nr:response regulator [Campylobacterales bacterium]